MFNEWIERARKNNYLYIIIMYDKEDKDKYPVFVESSEELDLLKKQLTLSINKQELIDVITVDKLE